MWIKQNNSNRFTLGTYKPPNHGFLIKFIVPNVPWALIQLESNTPMTLMPASYPQAHVVIPLIIEADTAHGWVRLLMVSCQQPA